MNGPPLGAGDAASRSPSSSRRDALRAASGEVAVHPVTPEKLPHLWEMVLELADYERMKHLVSGTPEQLGRLLFGGSAGLEGLVAEQAGRLVGYALYYPRYSSFRTCARLWLEDLYVAPAARGSGAGRALLAEVARIAIARGCDRVDWDVLEWNQLAIDFYERQGGNRVVADWVQFGMDDAALRRLAERDSA